MKIINMIRLSAYPDSDKGMYYETRCADRIKLLWWDGQGFILRDLKVWIEDTLQTLPQKQKLAEAMRYALSRWAALSVYVDDGRCA